MARLLLAIAALVLLTVAPVAAAEEQDQQTGTQDEAGAGAAESQQQTSNETGAEAGPAQDADAPLPLPTICQVGEMKEVEDTNAVATPDGKGFVTVYVTSTQPFLSGSPGNGPTQFGYTFNVWCTIDMVRELLQSGP